MRVELDMPLTLKEIVCATGGKIDKQLNVNETVKAICTDTRECRESDLFIALRGTSDSGEFFVKEALSKKCAVISSSYDSGIIRVKDTSDALLEIAKMYKSKIGLKYTVAVTGSVGKSTTVRFISEILRKRYKVHSPVGNFNNHIGVPLTVLSAPCDTEVLIVELGMNHEGEISRLSKCVEPDIGVITFIGTSHIGNLGSRKKIADAKLEILDGMHNSFLLLPHGEPLLSNINSGLYVSRNSSLSDFSFNDVSNDTYCFKSKYGSINNINFSDKREHILYNLAFSISVAQILKLTEYEIIKGIGAITKTNLRQRLILLKTFTIFDDSYNASLESITADLKYISSLGKPTGAFLGDVLELGDNAISIHEEIGRTVSRLNIDRIYLYGKYSEHIARGAIEEGMSEKRIFINTDIASPEISISHIKENHALNEIILFKASHLLRLDKIADMIEQEERNNND